MLLPVSTSADTDRDTQRRENHQDTGLPEDSAPRFRAKIRNTLLLAFSAPTHRCSWELSSKIK